MTLPQEIVFFSLVALVVLAWLAWSAFAIKTLVEKFGDMADRAEKQTDDDSEFGIGGDLNFGTMAGAAFISIM